MRRTIVTAAGAMFALSFLAQADEDPRHKLATPVVPEQPGAAAPESESRPAEPLTLETKNEAEALIEQLGHDSFATREKATEKLVEMGRPVIPLLKEHRQSPDLEVRNRIAKIMERLEGQAAKDVNGPNIEVDGNKIRIIGGDGNVIRIIGVEGQLRDEEAFRGVRGGAVVRPAQRPADQQNEEDGIEPKK